MLDFDYPQYYAEVVRSTTWSIELPEYWSEFFEQTGIVAGKSVERREKQRRIVRTCGLLYIDAPLPAIPREPGPIGVYTRDFSNDACGIVSPIELYPDEEVRLVLPTFWLQLRVVRTHRKTSTCYEVGLELLRRHDPSRSAFIVGGRFMRAEALASM